MCTGGGGNGSESKPGVAAVVVVGWAEVDVLGVVGAAPALVVVVVEENDVELPLLFFVFFRVSSYLGDRSNPKLMRILVYLEIALSNCRCSSAALAFPS